jgi:uncharacterized repeat protein (TIGR01451 family)
MSFRRISIPAAMLLVLLLQFLPGTVFAPQPAAAAYCDSAQFIADVTIPDGTVMAPGATFVKTWRLQNIGTCTWTTAYSIVFTGGDQLGAPAVVNMPYNVAPGASVDISVNMTAPLAAGHYRGNWKLRNASGYIFGVGGPANYLFWVDIYVNSTYTTGTTYDFVANYCSALWASGAGGLACPGTSGNTSGYVMKVDSPQLETGSVSPNPGLLVSPQQVAGGYIKAFYPAYTVQAGDHFQSIVNCAYGATGCYVNFQLQYQIGGGTIHTLWSFNERYEGLYYPVNLDLSSLAGQNVNFILYMADVSGYGSPSGDQAMWVGPKVVGPSTGGYVPPITPPGVCDRGAFVSDVTIPDGTVMAPGTAFTKTWRIRNVGTCTWTTSYQLVYAFGTLMSSSSAYNLSSSVAPVAPGATADFSVDMVAPTTPGHYRSYWRFKNASGVQFGVGSGYVTFFADIYVSGSIGSTTSTTTITADTPDPSTTGQSVPVSVTVSGSSGTPTGTVSITGADTNCTMTLSGGSGTCNVIFSTSGTKTLTAIYSGNGTYASSSDTESHTVNNSGLATSTTVITADSPDPSNVGQTVTVSATVSGSSGTPTGTVSITGTDSNCTITLTSGSGNCDVLFNSAGGKTITATYNGNATYGTSSDTESHTVNSAIPASNADLDVSITDGVTTYNQGGITTYIIEVTNNGPHDVSGASFSDNKPAQVDSWTWTCAADVGASCLVGPYATSNDFSDTVNIPAGKSIVYSAVAHINSGATGSIVNSAIITPPGSTPDPIMGNNTATDTNTLSLVIPGPQADLAVTINNGGLATYVPGGTVTYTIEVRNNGPEDVTAASFTDNKPTQVTSWTVTCVPAAGASCTAGPVSPTNINDSVDIPAGSGVTYTVVANISGSAVGNLVNTATITNPVAVPDPNLANNSVTNTIAPPSADLAITKTDGITLWTPGGTTTYTVVVQNNGPLNVIGATFQDNKPAQVTSWSWTCTADSGASCTASGSGSGNISDTVNIPATKKVTYTITASLGTTVPGNLVNTATITSPVGMPDPILGNNSATDTDNGPTADLAVTKDDGVTFYTPGDTLTYTIRVTNNGPQTVIGASFEDDLPAQIAMWSWTCVPDFSSTCTAGPTVLAANFTDTINLAAGQGVTYTVSALVNGAATGNLVNTASVTAPGAIPDPVPGNNTATDTDAAPTADLSVTKTDGVSIYPLAGGTVTYHIVVTNNGPAGVTSADVSDTRPPQISSWIWTCVADSGASCTAGPVSPVNFNDSVDIPAGKKVTYTVVATITGGATGDMTNTVTVTAPIITPDPIAANNTASDVDAHPSADLSITKDDSVLTYTAGGNLIYTITVSNAGPSDVVGARVHDSLPGQILNWQWSCAADLGATCSNSGVINTAFNDTVNIPVGKKIVYTVTVVLKGGATGTLTNTATVSEPLPIGTVPDPNLVNNSASDIDTLAP